MLKKPPIITDVRFFNTTYIKRPPAIIKGRPYSSLSIRRSGIVSVTSNDKVLYSAPDTLTFVPGGYDYTTEIIEDGAISIFHFNTADINCNISDIPIVAKPQFPQIFYNLFDNAIRHYTSDGCDLFCLSAAYELLNEASFVFFGSSDIPPPKMSQCKEYIDENFCNSSLRVNMLAKMCGFSDAYFRREFRRYYDESPIMYIKKKRIDLACRLLLTGDYSITEIATRTGFDSVSYFSSEFRHMIGTTPSEYRAVTSEFVGLNI